MLHLFGQIIIKLTDYFRVVQLLKEIYISQHFNLQRKNKNKEINDNASINEPGISHNQIYEPTQKRWKEASRLQWTLRNAWWGYKRYPFKEKK